MWQRLACLFCLAVLSTSPACAQKSQEIAQGPVRVVPIRMAKAVVSLGLDGRLHADRISDWIPYRDRAVHNMESMSVAHDTFEGVDDGTGHLMPGERSDYIDNCGVGSGRWYLGDGYEPGWRYNDMPYTQDARGKTANHVAFSFYCEFGSQHDFRNCIFTTEDFPLDAAGANAEINGGSYPGIVFSYGQLAASKPHYYYSDIDLTGSGLSFQMPNGGQGGVLELMGDADDVAGAFTLVGQHMLWGIKSGNPTPQQSAYQWDDDNPPDFEFTDDISFGSELYSYEYGLCPDPWSISIGFYYSGSGNQTETLCPQTVSVNLGKVTRGDVTSLASDDGNVMTVCKFIVPSQTSPFVRMTESYTTTKSYPTAIELEVKAKMANAGSFKIRGFLHDYSNQSDTKVMGDSSINQSFSRFSGMAPGQLSHYVGYGGAMQSRVEIQQVGPSTVTSPCATFELINLEVTG